MALTIPYAKVGELAHANGRVIDTSRDVEVIDRVTGKTPVGSDGRTLAFQEVNAAEGWGVVLDWKASSEAPHDVWVRIEGDFEIRVLEEAA